MNRLIVVYDGELSKDIADQLIAKKQSSSVQVTLRSASDKPKSLVSDYCHATSTTVICFIIQTIENASPTEDGGTCLRFFKRKTNPSTMLSEGFFFTVLGLGNSNLLLDRQTTGPSDCNQVAQDLDSRLNSLGGTQYFPLGLADERIGLDIDVEPWMVGLWAKLNNEAKE